MSINFPSSLDSLTNPTSTDKMNVVPHADQHSNTNDAIEALEAKVGINGSAVTTSHDYKLGEVTSSDKAVGKTATQTLTNKTLTSPTINTPSISGGTISSSSISGGTISGITLSGTNTLGGTNTFSGTNTFTGATTFNTSLPTSSVTPTNSSDLITKAYADANSLPSQTSNSGKFLTTNGSSSLWDFITCKASASDTLQLSADTERFVVSGTTYGKKKEIQVFFGGQCRVKFDIKMHPSEWSAYGKIYINGNAIGTERSTTSTSYATFSEDFYLSAGDRVQLYEKDTNGYGAYVKNFRIYFDKSSSTDGTVITD